MQLRELDFRAIGFEINSLSIGPESILPRIKFGSEAVAPRVVQIGSFSLRSEAELADSLTYNAAFNRSNSTDAEIEARIDQMVRQLVPNSAGRY